MRSGDLLVIRPVIISDAYTTRYGGTTLIRKLEQKELLFRHNTGLHVAVNHFDGEIAVPCALLGAWSSHDAKHPNNSTWPGSRGAPNTGMWMWQDSNGDGQMAPTEFTDLSDDGYVCVSLIVPHRYK